MDAAEQKALSDIKQYGCHVIHVLGENDMPPFTYSVGIWKSSNAPEIVVIGLKQQIAHFMVNEYNRRVRMGEIFEERRTYGGFLEGFDCVLREVDKVNYPEYLGWNRWLYKGDGFRALQLIYPSTAGAYPWEPGASEWFRSWQALLCTPSVH